MVKWDDLLKAETGIELFILLNEAFRCLPGSPEIRIDGIPESDELGLQMEVLQTVTVRHEGSNKISRPVTQVFILLRDGTLNWELKLTGERISGLADILARLRQIMEDSRAQSRLSGDTEALVWDSEWILEGGYVPRATKPTATWTIPHSEKKQPRS